MSDDAALHFNGAEPEESPQDALGARDASTPHAETDTTYTSCDGDPQMVGEWVAHLRELHVADSAIKKAFGTSDLGELLRASGRRALSELGNAVLADVLVARREAEVERDRIAAAVESHAVGLAEVSVIFPGQTPKPAESKPMSGQVLDLMQLATTRQPPPAFVVPGWLPEGYVTLLAAHGEGGKSQIALYIGIAIAAGLPVLGRAMSKPRRVAYYSCEDRAGVLRYRIQQYCEALQITPDILDGWLFVIDAAEMDSPELYVADRDNGKAGRVTPAYHELSALMKREAIDIVVIDNASDVYAANEVDRPTVRAFVRWLQRLLPGTETGAVLLLGHVNRAASLNGTTGQQYSGSTAWHNSVRSRWELTRPAPKKRNGSEADDEADDEMNEREAAEAAAQAAVAPYLLRRVKGNYSAPEWTATKFYWSPEYMVIVPDTPLSGPVQAIERRNFEHHVLQAMLNADAHGTRVSANPQANNNPAIVLSKTEPGLPRGLSQMKRLQPVLTALKAREAITLYEYKKTNREPAKAWALTDKGRAEAQAQD